VFHPEKSFPNTVLFFVDAFFCISDLRALTGKDLFRPIGIYTEKPVLFTADGWFTQSWDLIEKT
jgi:hypothetical protein